MDDYYFDKTIYLFKYHDLAVKYSDEENYFYLDINFHLENYEHQHYSKMAIDGSDKNGIFCISMHKDFYSDQLNFGYSDNFDETHNSIYVQLQDNIDFQYYAIVEPNTQTLCDGLNK
jgi:hypothetical protein